MHLIEAGLGIANRNRIMTGVRFPTLPRRQAHSCVSLMEITTPSSQMDAFERSCKIYFDIQYKVGLNPQFTCSRDGYSAPLDVGMCQLYSAYKPYDRTRWAIISRPA